MLPPPATAARRHAGLNAGIGLALLAMLAFAAMDGVSKILAGTYAIPQILWVRYIFFTLLAVVVLRPRGFAAAARSRRPWLQGARGLLLVVENGMFVLAFKFLPLADVHAIAAASPLIVIALSVPVLAEKVGPRRWLAVLLGFAGVILIVRPGFKEIGLPILIALAGALLWGLYQVMLRLAAQTDSSATTWVWSAAVGLAATTLAGPFSWTWPTAEGWALLLALAVLGSFAHLALIKALGTAEASLLQPFGYTLLVWAAVIGYLLFGDIPDRWTITGAALIVASGLYAWHRERLQG